MASAIHFIGILHLHVKQWKCNQFRLKITFSLTCLCDLEKFPEYITYIVGTFSVFFFFGLVFESKHDRQTEATICDSQMYSHRKSISANEFSFYFVEHNLNDYKDDCESATAFTISKSAFRSYKIHIWSNHC